MAETLTPRPYARLFKMLGEDLIKDEKTALIELIKNAYDADATWVTVDFKNFGAEFVINGGSKIIIEDNGIGMTESIIKNEWINPATPYKKNQKNINVKTEKGRILQGEKGIGRFSMFKLGKTIEVHSKSKDEPNDNIVSIDLSEYDMDFITESEETSNRYLEDVEIVYSKSTSSSFVGSLDGHQKFIFERTGTGTKIIISNLLGNWNSKKVKEVYSEVAALQSISPVIKEWDRNKKLIEFNKNEREFTIHFLVDGVETTHKVEYEENLVRLLNLIKEKSFLEVKNGYFSDVEKLFSYELNNEPKVIRLSELASKDLPPYKRYLNQREDFKDAILQCGPFSFEFYIFLFDKRNNNKFNAESYLLNDEEKEILKKHRIYLYRDGIRVYPYGEPKDDWLQTDTLRGLHKAGYFFSNDQAVGFINISYNDNPNLQDKTNREGLIENGEATSELIVLIQTFLSYLRTDGYVQQIKKLEEQKRVEDNKKREERKKEEEDKQKEEEERKKKEEEQERERRVQEEQERKRREQEDQGRKQGESDFNSKKDREYQKSDTQHEPNPDEDEEIASEIETEIEMRNKKKNLFFKRSDILKSSFEKSQFYLNHNELIEQLSSLKYSKHYLLFVLSFRVLIEDLTKKYIVGFKNMKLKSGLGENVSVMIDDIMQTTRRLSKPQQATINDMLGGYHGYYTHLSTIKEEFFKNGAQGSLSNTLNSLSHSPRRITEEDALNIANNTILPLIVVSEKLMEIVNETL